MNVYYNVEIQMAMKNVLTDELLRKILPYFDADETDVDEHEKYRAVLFFKSQEKPSAMHDYVRDALNDLGQQIHYIDVIYRWETEMNPDRFVIWSDGTEKEYVGKINFEEATVR